MVKVKDRNTCKPIAFQVADQNLVTNMVAEKAGGDFSLKKTIFNLFLPKKKTL